MFVTILERLGLLVLVFLNSIYLLIKHEDKCMFNPSEWRDAREVKTWQYGFESLSGYLIEGVCHAES